MEFILKNINQRRSFFFPNTLVVLIQLKDRKGQIIKQIKQQRKAKKELIGLVPDVLTQSF